MRTTVIFLSWAILFLAAAPRSFAQRNSWNLPVTKSFKAALEKGHRSTAGKPGKNYWSNFAHYQLTARLDPQSAVVQGHAVIRYQNRSPRALDQIRLHLRQNIHKEDSMRLMRVEITGGVAVKNISVRNGEEQETLKDLRTRTRGTVIHLRLGKKIAPNQRLIVELDWSYKVPGKGAPRNGHLGDSSFYLGYWYPQVAVFDDVDGWVADQYLGQGEFYMGYGDYDVEFTVPTGYVVRATGQHLNAAEVLHPQILARLKKARSSGDVVHIVEHNDLRNKLVTRSAKSGTLTWKYQAENVRDFALGVSNEYLWDATTAEIPGRQDACEIHALYRKRATGWRDAAKYAKHAIEWTSKKILPYPYPHVSACEGVVGGGMEFPMMTAINAGQRREFVQNVICHELIHMWFPMLVGSNEKRWAWMDEGITSCLEALASADYWQDPTKARGQIATYLSLAGRDFEMPTMTHADKFGADGRAYGVATYMKTAAVLQQLRTHLGDELFFSSLRDFAQAWQYKHPRPEDLFSTFERVTKKELDWYFRTWFHETWTLDHAIDTVIVASGKTEVQLKDMGKAPHPTVVEATFANGSKRRQTLGIEGWLQGDGSRKVVFQGEAQSVELDPDRYSLDVDRSNGHWSR